MKYSVTHCYTDKNKGDAAIVIATTQLLRHIDAQAEIFLFSTYGVTDNRLHNEHDIIRKHADRLFPALFPEPVSAFGKKIQSLRLIPFLSSLIRSLFLLVSSNKRFIGLVLSEEEYCGFKSFIDSDVIISKGGSYLYTENSSIRSSLSLIRMLYPFILAWRYGKRSVIFGQSLGPLVGRFNQCLFSFVLSKVDYIYLRESVCIDAYVSVKALCNKKGYQVIPDTAFFLKDDYSDPEPDIKIDATRFNVGFTIVDNDYKYIGCMQELTVKKESYKKSISEAIKYLIDNYAAEVHIFPQVLADSSFQGHNDLVLSKNIVSNFVSTKYSKHLHLYEHDLSPLQLRRLYGQMTIFIGTRLHSVIFALSVGVPAITIAYHGTKSEGILKQIHGCDKFVLDINEINSIRLIQKIEELVGEIDSIKRNLHNQIRSLCAQLVAAVKNI